MAQRIHRLAIADASFPLLSTQQGRTIIGATSEEIYDKGNKPSLYYCHNVMPTLKGLDSVTFKEAAKSAAGVNLQDVREIYSATRKRRYIAWNDKREAYFLTDTFLWGRIADTVPSTEALFFDRSSVTIGTVNGVSYIFFSRLGAFVFNSDTDSLDAVTLSGIDGVIANYLGVTGANGYLIAYTENSIAWSSTIDPTDFVPSEVTGAGGGKVGDIGGAIQFVLTNSLGIIIYSETNAVAGTYTTSTKYPFKFKEITGSKGGLSLDLIAYDANAAIQFTYGKAGLQTVDSREAKVVLPEITDFLSGRVFEDYDELTGELTQTDIAYAMKKKIKFIASRYLVISYGMTEFTHAIIYDVALERLGKIKLTHTDCLEYVETTAGHQIETAKESIGFLLADGSIQVLDTNTDSDATGVVLLGKFQYTRTRTITLLEIEVESIKQSASLAVSALYSLDGRTTQEVTSTASYSADGLRAYPFRVTGINHRLKLVGSFSLTNILMTYLAAGRR